jgi:hypothetical protein
LTPGEIQNLRVFKVIMDNWVFTEIAIGYYPFGGAHQSHDADQNDLRVLGSFSK